MFVGSFGSKYYLAWQDSGKCIVFWFFRLLENTLILSQIGPSWSRYYNSETLIVYLHAACSYSICPMAYIENLHM